MLKHGVFYLYFLFWVIEYNTVYSSELKHLTKLAIHQHLFCCPEVMALMQLTASQKFTCVDKLEEVR